MSSTTLAITTPSSRPRRPLRPIAISVVLAIVVFVVTAYFTSGNKAAALVGHPEVLRQGCSWDVSKNFVQNCRVWSPSQNKWVTVQIRASNDSTRGVYLLDGMRARDDRSAWTTDVQASQIYDRSTNTTLVMPVGGASSFYTDWNAGAGAANTTIKQETFLTSELPAYLEREFGVARSNNAIVGLSMSAGPAVTLAAKHPEQFKVVQAMSGYYQIDNPIGALGVFATQALVSNYTNGIVNMWGAPGSAQWAENDPSKNLAKLKQNGQVLVVSSGNAVLTPQDLARMSPVDQISAVLLEALSAVSTVLFQLQAAQNGVSVVSVPDYGGHNWANWSRGLTGGQTAVMDALRASPPVTQKATVLRAALIGSASPTQTAVTASSSVSSAPSTTSTPSSGAASSGASAAAPAPSSEAITTSAIPSTVPVSDVPASESTASDTPVSESTVPASGDPSATVVTTTPVA